MRDRISIEVSASDRERLAAVAADRNSPQKHVLVDGVIVEDRVDQLTGRHGSLNAVQKADEFLVAMARHAVADDGAVEDIERREQRGRAIANIIVRHRKRRRVRVAKKLSTALAQEHEVGVK